MSALNCLVGTIASFGELAGSVGEAAKLGATEEEAGKLEASVQLVELAGSSLEMALTATLEVC